MIFRVSSSCKNGGCVAVATLPDGRVAVRNSESADGPVLVFTHAEWDEFVAGAKRGEFDPSHLP